MYSTAFLKDLAERVVSTFLQALIPALGLSSLHDGDGFDVTSVDWSTGLTVAAGAAFLALVKGVIAGLTSPDTGASLGTTIPMGHDHG